MDPLSITASCLAIAGAAAKTSATITSFVRNYRDAFKDLTSISGQLTELRLILDQLGDDGEYFKDIIPATFGTEIQSILRNCKNIIDELNDVMSKYRGNSASTRWAMYGKDKVDSLSLQLRAHISVLHIALDITSLTVGKAVRQGVNQLQVNSDIAQQTLEAVRRDTTAIRDDTARIKTEIQDLCHTIQESMPLPVRFRASIESFTSYTRSICEEIVWSDDEGNSEQQVQEVNSGPSTLANPYTTGNKKDSGPSSRRVRLLRNPQSPNTPGDKAVMELSGHCSVFVPQKNLVAVSAVGHIALYKFPSGELWRETYISSYAPRTKCEPPQFSPDGSLMGLVIGNGRNVFVGLISDLANNFLLESDFIVDLIAISPGNKTIALANVTGNLTIFAAQSSFSLFSRVATWHLAEADGGINHWPPQFFLRDRLVINDMAFSPCGTKLVLVLGSSDQYMRQKNVWTWIFTSSSKRLEFTYGSPYQGDLWLVCWDTRRLAAVTLDSQSSNPYFFYPRIHDSLTGAYITSQLPMNRTSEMGLFRDIEGRAIFNWAIREENGKFLLATCHIPANDDMKGLWRGRVIIWGVKGDVTEIENQMHEFQCPQFSSDLKYLMVQLAGTDIHQIWEL